MKLYFQTKRFGFATVLSYEGQERSRIVAQLEEIGHSEIAEIPEETFFSEIAKQEAALNRPPTKTPEQIEWEKERDAAPAWARIIAEQLGLEPKGDRTL